MTLTKILVNVWQNNISLTEGLEEINYLSRDGTLSNAQEEQVLEILEAIKKHVLTVNKGEEEILWALNEICCQI